MHLHVNPKPRKNRYRSRSRAPFIPNLKRLINGLGKVRPSLPTWRPRPWSVPRLSWSAFDLPRFRPLTARLVMPLTVAALILAFTALAVALLTTDPTQETAVAAVPPIPPPARQEILTQTPLEPQHPVVSGPETTTISETVHPGQTLSDILNPYLNVADIHSTAARCAEVFPVTRFRVGQPYTITLLDDLISEFIYEIDSSEQLVMNFGSSGLQGVERQAIAYDLSIRSVAGTITSSLFGAVDKLGEKPELAIRLADIFGWDIDFVRDIREGDGFRLVVQERFREGEFSGYGPILAATFTNQGKTFQAFRFEDRAGRADYYDENGRSMRKAFLKAPLSFTRISSGYTNSRFHPILKTWRPHHGIDYAAPTGTPIMTVGDGVISARSYDNAAGRYVKVRHSNGYESIYNHMSKFASGTNPGSRVKQGQVIGYVGTTGYATGPHLDFRVKKNGEYVNPLTIKSPPANPVPAEHMAAFQMERERLLALINVEDSQDLAATTDRPRSGSGS
ncbi:MAG: peptidase M23 [Deltaproteobacteria bacterium]|nr:peptidase M23 [Deltaproteobacteria bacterium]